MQKVTKKIKAVFRGYILKRFNVTINTKRAFICLKVNKLKRKVCKNISSTSLAQPM